jgi:septal ring factor EnvC (AmiA/AmiB activator)
MRPRLLILALVLAASAAAAQTPRPLTPSEAQEARGQIETLTRELARLAAEQARGGDTLGADRARLTAMNSRQAELSARLGANQNELSHLLSALQLYGRHPPPALLLHPEDAKKAVQAMVLINYLKPGLESRARALSGEVEAAGLARRQAAQASESLFTSESQVADRASRIETLIAQRQELQRRLGEDAGEGPDSLTVSARAQTLRARNAAPSVALRTGGGPLRFTPPLAAAPSARFNDEARGGPIQGWVWETARGASIASPATARVEYAGPLPGWESVVILDPGEGYHIVLAGLRSLTVAAGQNIAGGQSLGRMAPESAQNRGSAGPELYLEVRKGGEPVDPARFFAAIER